MSVQIKKLSDGVFRLPDGSIAYSMDRALTEVRKVKGVEYSVNDLILFVLQAQPNKKVRGRTVIFKEVFVIEREAFGKYLFAWDNVPGDESEALIRFIRNNFHLLSTEKTHITETSGKRTIRLSDSDATLSLRLTEDETKAILTIDESGNEDIDPAELYKPLYEFFVRKQNDKLSIYSRTKDVEDCEFIPYHYGPYSFHVANKLENLISLGLIEREGKKDTSTESFKLTLKGRKVIAKKYDRLPPEIKNRMENLRKGLDQFSRRWILNHVYTYYPQFRVKSRIGHRYKLITWGKGKG